MGFGCKLHPGSLYYALSSVGNSSSSINSGRNTRKLLYIIQVSEHVLAKLVCLPNIAAPFCDSFALTRAFIYNGCRCFLSLNRGTEPGTRSEEQAMRCQFIHQNFNVLDLAKSIAFYETNLGLQVEKRRLSDDGSFELVFLGDGSSAFQLELTWLRDWKEPYNLGDNETHLAVRVPDIEVARAFHREQGVICYENVSMGIYFIADPDGYWIEIVK